MIGLITSIDLTDLTIYLSVNYQSSHKTLINTFTSNYY